MQYALLQWLRVEVSTHINEYNHSTAHHVFYLSKAATILVERTLALEKTEKREHSAGAELQASETSFGVSCCRTALDLKPRSPTRASEVTPSCPVDPKALHPAVE